MFRPIYMVLTVPKVKTVEVVISGADKIKDLEVKGARNVAIAALEAIDYLAKKTKTKNRQAFIKELEEAREIFFASRPTEPLMRNAVNWVIRGAKTSDLKNVKDVAHVVSSCSCEFRKCLEHSRERIAEIGAKRILDGMVIFTHCHSSTVTYLLKKAKQSGKNFEVICTETRPAFQGRITAKEMLQLGIKTTLIVDSAARSFMKNADIAIVGADAITSEGNVVNKIGTAAIALFAREARVPFYVVTELLKFDQATLWGEYEGIEERGGGEVWQEAPKKLCIRNPAFEVTRRDFIDGIICEGGVIPPHAVVEIVQRKYQWIF